MSTPPLATAELLNTLPVELVHDILSDLDAHHILSLVTPPCAANAYLTACLHSHPTYGALLTPPRLATLSGYYAALAKHLPHVAAAPAPSIDLGDPTDAYNELHVHFVATVRTQLKALPYTLLRCFDDGSWLPTELPDDDVLAVHCSQPDVVQKYFDLLFAARAARRAHLLALRTRLAALLETRHARLLVPMALGTQESRTYLEMLGKRHARLLVPTQQGTQEPRTASGLRHVVRALRAAPPDCDRAALLWWLPADRTLRMVLRVLRRFPTRGMVDRESLASVELREFWGEKPPAAPLLTWMPPARWGGQGVWPEALEADVAVALHGLKRRWRHRGMREIDKEEDWNRLNPLKGQNCMQFAKRVGPVKKGYVLELCELDWLEAWMRVCAYILDEMDQVPWSVDTAKDRSLEDLRAGYDGPSVSAYWRVKMGEAEEGEEWREREAAVELKRKLKAEAKAKRAEEEAKKKEKGKGKEKKAERTVEV
ncbi:hypothetical protein EDC01DRAFT_644081, partial [Geopyxis carbonaria]